MSTILPPSPLPEYVYKIIPSPPPSPIPTPYPLSPLDQQDGFVHLSTAKQIPTTATLFFTTTPSLTILKLRLSNFDPASVKWDEVPGTNGCPHLYGNFGGGDVVGWKTFRRESKSEGGEVRDWKEVFEEEERGEGFLE
ncbi:hypothetical protein B0J18DRAFT_422592 [Chaetomium sp. MPI-SDFR-AT-0129]|nr:hypothetical protein B0J18DRAFT_422592 [Chaetomium sp. MPI-SDFR-AT-0129]